MAETPNAQADSRRSGKSASAFRTISEVAKELDLPQHVLRFWESKFSQIKPLKRGGGRRFYRPEDVDQLREIRALLYEDGYTIKGVQKLLRDRQKRSTKAEPSTTGTDQNGTAHRAPPAFTTEKHRLLAEVLIELEELRDVLSNKT